MAIPHVTIKAQTRNKNTVTVYGTVTGLGSGSVTAALPAAAVPAGAVSKPAASVSVNPGGEFAYVFTAVAYGKYAEAIVTATNNEGSHTAISVPMQVYAPSTAPVGAPAALFPANPAPVFAAPSVAVGAEVTTVTLESTSTSAQTNVPFTFGQPFKSGDLAPGNFLVGKIAGQADVPLQFNVKATHPNGSVRHAIISGVLPALAASEQKTISMVRAASGTSTTPAASTAISGAGLTALININVGGVAYSANATAALAAGLAAEKVWIGGAVCTEYTVSLPFKDGSNADQPTLTAQFNVRYYPGATKAKIDVVVEHTKAYAAVSDISYTGEVVIGGVSVMTIQGATAGSALVHFPAARWKRTFWWNNASPIHIKHNVPYLIGSRQVPNYDQSTVFTDALFADYVSRMAGPTFAPMGRGEFAAVFGGQGGRPELGLMPSWYATALLSQHRDAKRMMRALADCAGSWPTHRRDTSAGPNAGRPLDIVHFPYASIIGTNGDGLNPSTGQVERIPGYGSASTLTPDTSHQSAFSYLPYLLEGDFFYLEELHFWTFWNVHNQNPGYRFYERALFVREQVRGQGWSVRTLGQAAAVTPDDHPAKAGIRLLLDSNLNFFNETYTDNPNANSLGVIVNGAAIVYPNYATAEMKIGIGNFQDDYWMQSIGNAAELGFTEAKRLARWKAKYQVSRMIGEGICWIDACLYQSNVRLNASSPLYTTIAEVNAASWPVEVRSLPCNSPERVAKALEMKITTATKVGEIGNYASTTEGFASNYQPALAYAVDVGYPNADLAWELFDSRTVKPNYGTGPQFAVLPRGASTEPGDPADPLPPTVVPDDIYSGVAGMAMFFGRSN